VKHVDLVGLHIEAGSGESLVLLREHDAPHRVLPIFIGDTEAVAIAGAFAEEPRRRPVTHDLMATLVETLHAHVERVEVTGLRDGALLAELAVSGPTGDRRVDSRPSDAIALAVRVDAPLFVSAEVLDQAGAILLEDDDDMGDEVEDDDFDDEVDRFRSFLDAVDPTDFHGGGSDSGSDPGPEPGPGGDDPAG
jgi:hypothetical protein